MNMYCMLSVQPFYSCRFAFLFKLRLTGQMEDSTVDSFFKLYGLNCLNFLSSVLFRKALVCVFLLLCLLQRHRVGVIPRFLNFTFNLPYVIMQMSEFHLAGIYTLCITSYILQTLVGLIVWCTFSRFKLLSNLLLAVSHMFQ